MNANGLKGSFSSGSRKVSEHDKKYFILNEIVGFFICIRERKKKQKEYNIVYYFIFSPEENFPFWNKKIFNGSFNFITKY